MRSARLEEDGRKPLSKFAGRPVAVTTTMRPPRQAQQCGQAEQAALLFAPLLAGVAATAGTRRG